MSLIGHKLAAATAVAAAFSLAATPAAAVELPRLAGQQLAKAGALDVENRHHRGHHGHGGWGDDDIDAGDVLAGVLILGGIAAIASAAGKSREQSYPEPYPDDARYRGVASDTRSRGGGMSDAVDRCVAEVEAGTGAVDSVDSASRDGAGWRVSGELADGGGYWCAIDDDGRISVGGSGSAYAEPVPDEQYDDAYYARARASKASAQVDSDLGDDRYAMAQAGE